ncbi:MAG: LppX_LprAFG lipoprotein, partial [Thermomicrobiaceae bacterium]|nr:LppX_LprAFG lipoprotein [Thermomicrobiaceae bacterium]
MRPRALCAAIVLALGSMLALAACGGSNKPTPTPTPSAQSILDAAAQRFGQINSAHFKLQIAGNVYLDEARTLTLRGAEGDIARPDRASAKAQVAVASQNLNISMIAIGNDQYITNFLTGSWMRAPSGLSYNPAILFDEQQG